MEFAYVTRRERSGRASLKFLVANVSGRVSFRSRYFLFAQFLVAQFLVAQFLVALVSVVGSGLA
jgi:hypothetical protein